MTKDSPLDRIDRKILHELQREGRVTFAELAERVGLSKTPCLNRVKRLEADGFIRGYRADLDPNRIHQGHLVYIQIKLSDTKRASLAAFNAAVLKIPQIMSCHMMTGGYDYLLKVRTKDMKTYRQFLGEILSDLPGVDQTSTFPVMEHVKDTNLFDVWQED